ncbi:MAG: hypothetical protein SGI99_05820 [Pseudomonadota bacterium]|nr:hypothetical protein [Pseudomonadota bacterium]
MKDLDLAAEMFRQLQETLTYLVRWSERVAKYRSSRFSDHDLWPHNFN